MHSSLLVTFAVGALGVVLVAGATRAARRFSVRGRLPARASGAPRRVPARLERRLAVALDRAGLTVGAGAALQLWLAAIATAGILGVALGGVPTGLGATLAAAVCGPVSLASAHGRRARIVALAVPAAVDQVAAELRAGGTITTAVTTVARGDGPLAADFARVHARLGLGAPLADALRAWARERDTPGIAVVAGALATCAVVGGRSADALEGLASSLRDRLAVAAEARALSAQARMSAVVVGGMPLAYLAWSALADRHALHALVGTEAGRVCIVAGVGLEALGVWWMRRILRAGSFA